MKSRQIKRYNAKGQHHCNIHYCSGRRADDILQRTAYKEDGQRRVNDAMLLTTVLISGWYFGGNWEAARGYMLQHHCQYMLDKSRFCRRVHSCRELAIWLFSILGWISKQLNHRQRYILDTFPVAVCHNIRIKNCRLLNEEDFRGKSVSKREYFYGFKVALLIDEWGNPVELAMYAGGYSEQSVLHRMSFDFHQEVLFGKIVDLQIMNGKIVTEKMKELSL